MSSYVGRAGHQRVCWLWSNSNVSQHILYLLRTYVMPSICNDVVAPQHMLPYLCSQRLCVLILLDHPLHVCPHVAVVPARWSSQARDVACAIQRSADQLWLGKQEAALCSSSINRGGPAREEAHRWSAVAEVLR
jgi:hypothetical protein